MDIQAYIQSGVIESYVLGLASASEVAELEVLRAQHLEVNEAIQQFSELLEQETFNNAVAPPPELKSKVLAALKEENSHPKLLKAISDNETHFAITLNSIRPWRMAAAASVILLIVSAALNFYLYRQYHEKNDAFQALVAERNTLQANNQVYQTHLKEWETAAEMMADPRMATVKMKGIPGKESNMATIFWNTQNKDVYVMPNKLPDPVEGKQYQLWAIVDGKPVDAGTLDPDCNGVCKMKNIPKAQAFAITLEKAGGSPVPTLSAMLVQGGV